MKQMIKTGSVVGAGAAINVSLGFVPTHVRVVNVTDGTTIDEWFAGMAAGTSITNNSAAVATRAANGITAFAGSASAPAGFTIGSAIAVNAKTLAYIAIRDDD